MWLLSQVKLTWKNERKSITHVVRIHWHENGTCQRFEHCLIWNETCETQLRLCIEFSLPKIITVKTCTRLSTQWMHPVRTTHKYLHSFALQRDNNVVQHPLPDAISFVCFPILLSVGCEPVPAICHSTWFGPIFRRECDANGEKIAKIPN